MNPEELPSQPDEELKEDTEQIEVVEEEPDKKPEEETEEGEQ